MQRKNSILRKLSHRSGMAMIMAVAVIVIIATIMTLSLNLTTQTSKKTTDLYLYEQTVLLSKSAAEYAILRSSLLAPCTFAGDNFIHNNAYDINISIQYISFNGSTCDTNANALGIRYSTTTATESDGTIIMDIKVSTGTGTEPITYFRRSIQKL